MLRLRVAGQVAGVQYTGGAGLQLLTKKGNTVLRLTVPPYRHVHPLTTFEPEERDGQLTGTQLLVQKGATLLGT